MIHQETLPISSERPRGAMVSIHGYVAAQPQLGAVDTGGQVMYVLELSKKLAAKGFSIDIFTRRFENQKKIEQVADHVRIVRMRCGGDDFIPKEYMYEHASEWVENTLGFISSHVLAYEFINSHYWDAGVASMRLSRKLEVPHIHTPHSLGRWKLMRMNDEYEEDPAAFERKYNFQNRINFEEKIYQQASAITATSQVQFEILKDQYNVASKNIYRLPPGFDENKFTPVSNSQKKSLQKEWNIEDKKVVITLGRLASNKGYDLLIDAFNHISEQEPDAVLLMAVGGKSNNNNEIKLLDELKTKVSRLKLEDRIHFLPFIPDKKLPGFYQMADTFVLPSRYEPFGMVAIEAMACETPAVLTTRGGLWHEFTYGENALFANVTNKRELGKTIWEVLQHPFLKRHLARNAADKVHREFTWTHVAQRLLNIVGKGQRPEQVTQKAAL